MEIIEIDFDLDINSSLDCKNKKLNKISLDKKENIIDNIINSVFVDKKSQYYFENLIDKKIKSKETYYTGILYGILITVIAGFYLFAYSDLIIPMLKRCFSKITNLLGFNQNNLICN